jgi:hypothetical protein
VIEQMRRDQARADRRTLLIVAGSVVGLAIIAYPAAKNRPGLSRQVHTDHRFRRRRPQASCGDMQEACER